MLSQQEQNFLNYWQIQRNKNKLNFFLFSKGFSIGIFIGLLIVLSIAIGWNKQAPLNKINVPIISICFLIMAFFFGYLYNTFKYEQNEQTYKELLAKHKNHQSNFL